MKFDDLEKRMRELEVYHSARVVPEAWTILRLDGRGFTKFTSKNFTKPFDHRFHQAMVEAAQRLVVDMQALYAYTESDEISLLLPHNSTLFDREQEKLVSLSAGLASSSLSLSFQQVVQCDSRLCVAATPQMVIDYFLWRQADASRCCLNGWCYWTLRKEGLSARETTRQLHGRSFDWKNQMLLDRGIDFSQLPLWQTRGSGIYWKTYFKEGRNPISGESVQAARRQIVIDDKLPENYADFIGSFLRPPI